MPYTVHSHTRHGKTISQSFKDETDAIEAAEFVLLRGDHLTLCDFDEAKRTQGERATKR